VDEALIDGEAVVFQDDGRSDFHALLTKRGPRSWPSTFCVAKATTCASGQSSAPEALLRLVAKRRGDGILFSEALAEEGAVAFAKACELGLEGIVSKRAASTRAGRAATG
jgi:bifunctional non-homologous end joining protein LigD